MQSRSVEHPTDVFGDQLGYFYDRQGHLRRSRERIVVLLPVQLGRYNGPDHGLQKDLSLLQDAQAGSGPQLASY